jgi:hypothetical protein
MTRRARRVLVALLLLISTFGGAALVVVDASELARELFETETVEAHGEQRQPSVVDDAPRRGGPVVRVFRTS